MRARTSLIRSDQWWHHKVPPVIAVAALAIGAKPGPARAADLVDLGLLLCSVAGVAAFGHLVNDWADVESDARGGKRNALSAFSGAKRTGLVVASMVVGLVPWAWLPHRRSAWIALAVEVALLVAYSVPPIRLKGRGWLGAVADAGYAYAVPFVLTALALGPPGASGLVIGLLGGWGLLVGLRGILWHQVGDLAADRAAGVETAASRFGPSATQALVATYLLPVELALLAAIVVLSHIRWLPWLLAGFMVWRLFQVLLLWEPPLDLRTLADREARVRIVGFELVNELIERWLPLAAVVALTGSSGWWWLGVAVVLVGFRNAVRTFLGHDLWVVPDALERLAMSRGIRAEIRQVASQRRARIAAGPLPPPDPTARWIFVVCGPLPHLLTLRTAVHHLRPVTSLEIWVLTDSRRNEQVIDIEGVDHIVDVATPTELNDHQASIWLKTSVHRHVPPGEWCYLDSDIIAVAPGSEELFRHRAGPVAFASDVTIRENSVDRFSPWAMNCACLGYDDEHSCGHLREQLLARFAVSVPGDWLHWNGGVFLFGPDSGPFLELWHQRAIGSFAWPEWKTRDQGALIATVWTLGLQDLPRLPQSFNFIADLGNGDLCLEAERGWAHHPSGPWYQAKLLHLYTCPLEDPAWDVGADVEAVVMRRSRVRISRYRRGELKAAARHAMTEARGRAHDLRFETRLRLSKLRWDIQKPIELLISRGRRFPRRLVPSRVWRSVLRRLGIGPGDPDAPDPDEPIPQQAVGPPLEG